MEQREHSPLSRRQFLARTTVGVAAMTMACSGLLAACTAPAPTTTSSGGTSGPAAAPTASQANPTAASAGAAPGTRQASQVKAMASWLPQGSNLYMLVARDKGFWKQHGLDVEFSRGFGSGDSSKRAALGEQDFVQASMSAQMINSGKGLESVAVAMQVYKLPMGLFVLDKSPIRTPKDLEGKTIGATPTTGDFQLWPAFVQKTGINGDSVKFQFLSAAVRHPSLIDGKIDALSGYSMTELPPLMARDITVRSILYSDFGLEMYDLAIITTPKMIKERPEVVQAFVDGSMEAIKFTYLNPEESVDNFVNAVREVQDSEKDRNAIMTGLGLTNVAGFDPIQVTNGMGYMDPKVTADTLELVNKYMGLDKKPALEATYTNQFAGKVKLTEAELTKAKSNYAKFMPNA